MITHKCLGPEVEPRNNLETSELSQAHDSFMRRVSPILIAQVRVRYGEIYHGVKASEMSCDISRAHECNQ